MSSNQLKMTCSAIRMRKRRTKASKNGRFELAQATGLLFRQVARSLQLLLALVVAISLTSQLQADPPPSPPNTVQPKLPAPMPLPVARIAEIQPNEESAKGTSDQAIVKRGQGLLSPSGLTPTLKVMIALSLLSLAPAILVMTTSFVRFVIVFGLLRQALGTQQLPPNQVVMSLSLFLTMFVMMPVWKTAYQEGVQPYVSEQPIPDLRPGEQPLERVFHNTFRPIKRYMSQQIKKARGEGIVFMLIDFQRPHPESLEGQLYVEPTSFEEVDGTIIATAFMLSELKAAFILGFQIFLPFLVIDFVVSMLLTSMGMMMIPPTLISLPFKILLFVMIDGWTLITHMLLTSVAGSG